MNRLLYPFAVLAYVVFFLAIFVIWLLCVPVILVMSTYQPFRKGD